MSNDFIRSTNTDRWTAELIERMLEVFTFPE